MVACDLQAHRQTRGVESARLTNEQHLRFAPRMVELNLLIDDMRQRVDDEFKKALGLADTVGNVFRKHFGDSSFPKLGLVVPK